MAERNDEEEKIDAAPASMLASPTGEPSSADEMRRDIRTTRASIDEKLDALQDKMHTAKVKAEQIFDVRYQIEQHPWIAFGTAAAIGFLAGSMGSANPAEEYKVSSAGGQTEPSVSPKLPPAPSTPRLDLFGTLKIAVGAAMMDLAREELRKRIPALGNQLDKVWEGRGLTSVSAAKAVFDKGAQTP